MKKIYSLMILLAGLFCCIACDDDRDSNPTLKEPTDFILNTPRYTSGIYDLKNTESIQLTCSQPDYGFTAAVTYGVQVSMNEDFSDPKDLTTTYNTAKMDVDASEMAIALSELSGYVDEESYPADWIFPVYVRLSAVITESGADPIYSNVIKLPEVKSYFALKAMEMPENIYIIGNTIGNWDWGKAPAMIPVYGTAGQFWTIQYLGKTKDGDFAECKFNTEKDWNAGTPFGISADIDDASKTLAGLSGDNNIKVGNPGWYIVVVTTEISGRDYIFHVQFLEPKVYLTGDPSGGFDQFTDDRLFTVPADNGEFVSPACKAGGELRMCIKLENHDWWHTEFLVLNGKIEYRGAGGDQERVTVSAGQVVRLNFSEGTGTIE